MFTQVDHIGIAVKDMDAAVSLYEKASGAVLVGRETSKDGSIDLVMLRVGDDQIELLAPLEGESAIRKFLEARGEGLHHVAYEVDDIDSELDRLKASGYELIDQTARPGFMNTRIAFIHPKSTMGTLTELVEAAK